MKFVFEKDSKEYSKMGGKATALAKIGRAIDNIPDWFCVTFEGFDLENKEIKPEAIEEIKSKLNDFSDDTYFAIRSSAASEDSNANSFAGQFDTFLYVKKQDVIARVKDVYMSGFSDRVTAYKEENNINKVTVPAAIVQKMVNSEKAGVAFGVNPITSNMKEIVVSAVWGLGSGLVDGIATADTYTISGDKISKKIATKDYYHKLVNDEVKEEKVADELKKKQILDSKEILAVRDLVYNAGQFFGRYQDIEWAIEDGKLYLLQSRPITTLGNKNGENEKLNVFDNSNIVESYGGITTPLTFSFIRNVYENVYIELCKIFKVKQEKLDMNAQMFKNMLALIDGRVYYNLYGWYGILTMFPGLGSNKKFMESMMGVKESLPDSLFPVPQQTFKDKMGLVHTYFGLLGGFMKLRKMTKRFYARLNDALEDKDINSMSLYELYDYYYELESKLLHKWDAPLVNDFMAMIFYGQLKSECAKLFKEESNLIHNDLLTDEGGIISAEPAKRIKELARIAKDNDELIELLGNDDVLYIKKELPKYEEFNKKINEYLEKFSDRCLQELKLETETLKDNPRSLYHSIAAFAVRMKAGNVVDIDTEKNRREAEAKVRKALMLHPMHKRKFKFILKNARYTVKNRENLRFERTRLFGRVRELFLRIGFILTSMNVIDDKRDIFYLEVDEILFYINGKSTTNNLKDLIAIRKEQYEKYHEMNPDERFYTRGAVNVGNDFKHDSIKVVELNPKNKEETTKEETNNKKALAELKGIGASPGIVVGRARVIHNPANAKIEQGEVLIAEYTDPGWIMLFPSSSGILVERGSLLSHSAIVSRELGIPAVVGITNLINTVETGDLVRLDGTTGEVKVLEKSGKKSKESDCPRNTKELIEYVSKNYKDNNLYEGITYEEFAKKVKGFGSYIVKNNLNKTCGVISENRAEAEVAILAASMLSKVVLIDKDSTKEELENIINDSKIEVIYCSKQYLDWVGDRAKTVCLDELDSMMGEGSDIEVSDEAGFVFYTSGTTDKPKKVELTNKNVFNNLKMTSEKYNFTSDDVIVSVLPYNHVLEGLFDLLLSIKGGAKRVFCNDVNELVEAMFEKKATYVGGVPALYDVLFEEIKSLDEEKQKAIRENIKFLFSAGAPLKIETLNNFKELGIQILQGYGLTETSSAIALETLSENKVGSVGKVLEGIELKLIDKDENGAGEIIVKSDSNFAGAIDKEGFLHTGDVGTVDEEGYLFIVGRNKNMIVLDNGQKVFPEQLEEELNAIDGIKESLVYGEANKVKAVIVCDDGENALKAKIDALNTILPDFKQIKEVKYTSEPLPRTKTQKLIRDFKVENDRIENDVSTKNKSIEERVKEIIAEVLKKDISEIDLQSKIYEDLRADSLDTISINIKIEKELGEKIPREDSKGFITVEDIVRYCKNKKDE